MLDQIGAVGSTFPRHRLRNCVATIQAACGILRRQSADEMVIAALEAQVDVLVREFSLRESQVGPCRNVLPVDGKSGVTRGPL